MTRHSYDECYLQDVRCNLGDMFEYAVYDCGLDIDLYFGAFVSCGMAARLEVGDPRFAGGYSGFELAELVVRTANLLEGEPPEPTKGSGRTPEYWCGWILAYYQWLRCERFGNLAMDGLTPSRILSMYVLHEADESKFVEEADALLSESRRSRPSRLQTIRKNRQLTQEQLATMSDVSLRMVQLYEQRRNDISKAEFGTVLALFHALGCEPEALVEPPIYV